MIHFYTYYSVGGYKDMYLGNDGQNDEKRYYLPLLSIEKNQAEEQKDEVLAAKVRRQLALPSIGILTNDNHFGLPRMVNKVTAHGGFQVIFTHLEEEKFLVVIRDIQGSDKDESGRPIPFLLSFMSDSPFDLQKMRRLSGYLAKCTQTAKKELAAFLHYDPAENGLCFEQAQMLQWLNQIVSKPQNEMLTLANEDVVRITSEKEEIALLVTTQGVMPQYVLNMLSLSKAPRYSLHENLFLIKLLRKIKVWHGGHILNEKMVLPLDNPFVAEQYKQEWEERRNKKIRFWIKVGVVALIIIMVICFIVKCTNGVDNGCEQR